MIQDEILFLERLFRIQERGTPTVLMMNPDNFAQLFEELGLEPDEELAVYHGMEIIVDEDNTVLWVGTMSQLYMNYHKN